MAAKNYVDEVSAAPVKRFFVEMLTRDITLEDAILDLLDNCIDGIQRSLSSAALKKKHPYEGFKATIVVKQKSFCIEDNCGGIPWSLRRKAFRIGRTQDEEPAFKANALPVGAYGVGMKRAIFKLGRQALVQTETKEDAYEVAVPKGWMNEEENWSLQTAKARTALGFEGTRLTVTDLVPDVAATFQEEVFQKSLQEKISTHFAIIISKGFRVSVSFFGQDLPIIPRAVSLRFQEAAGVKGAPEIRPYVFHSKPESDLEVTVIVGLREPIPDAEKILTGQEEPTFTTDYAGITVICNDRVVLYCNRDELTGWGTAKVPSYHTQFIAISGYIEFKGDPAKLPTTTTKRGLQYSTRTYQQVLNRVRDGLRMFVDYTNWWKSNESEAKQIVAATPALSFADMKSRVLARTTIKLSPVQTGIVGEQYRPALPRPKDESGMLRIGFTRPKNDVMELAELKLKNFDALPPTQIPRVLGEQLFDTALKQARR